MKSILIILNQLIIRQFYELNAGLFLFLFVLLFGIVPPSQLVYYHLTIIEGILAIPTFLLIVSGLWFFYNLKCLQFIWKQLNEPANEFVYVLNQFPPYIQFLSYLTIQIGVYSPVLIYGLAVAVVGFGQAKWLLASGIILFHWGLCGLNATAFYYKINHPNPEKSYFLLSYLFNWRSPKTFPILIIEFVFNDLKLMWGLIKAFDLLIMSGFLYFFASETYDARIIFMGFLVGLIANCVLVFQIRRFENTFLLFSRNLPWSLPKRFADWGLVYSLILAPEFLFLLNQIPQSLHWQDFMAIVLFGNGLLLGFHSLLYRLGEDMDSYLRWVFGGFIAVYFLVLFGLYGVVAGLSLFWAYQSFRKHYYRFEKLENE
jgi:hypothetical protein